MPGADIHRVVLEQELKRDVPGMAAAGESRSTRQRWATGLATSRDI